MVTELERALRELMPDLLAYFARRLEDREDAADALAETLVVLWRQERRLPAESEELRRYAFGVARRVLSTARRGRMRRHALAERLRGELHTESAAEPVDPVLLAALAELRDADRELVLLVAWEGFGVAEAGAILGLRPDAARQRYARARARLRAVLA
jgi:RNA polymerase sigma-70 factor, ECF subfamily